MSMQEFFERMARDGDWSPRLYEGGNDLRTYNFVTRRTAVSRLLANDGTFERILDVGCGSGDYASIAREHNGSFHGIDFSRTMIAQAIEQEGAPNNLFVTGSGEFLPYRDQSFDLVLAMGYIEYFNDPDPPMRELRRVLKPGGTLVIQSFKWDLFSSLNQKVRVPLRSLLGKPMADPAARLNLPSDWVDTKQSRRELDELVTRHGFELSRGTFNNFYVFPRRMRVKFPKAYIRLSEAIGKVCPKLCGFLAVNYIAKYVLKTADMREAA